MEHGVFIGERQIDPEIEWPVICGAPAETGAITGDTWVVSDRPQAVVMPTRLGKTDNPPA